MFYFPLISAQNGDKCLSREKKRTSVLSR